LENGLTRNRNSKEFFGTEIFAVSPMLPDILIQTLAVVVDTWNLFAGKIKIRYGKTVKI